MLFARFGAQLEQGHVHVEQHLPLFGAAHHAFDPEEAGETRASRDRRDLVHGAAGVEDQVAGRQLDAALAQRLLDQQLAAVIFLGRAQEQRAGNVAAHPLRRVL
ncbi:hypothetical protein D3C85_1526630 [compost metagenome]